MRIIDLLFNLAATLGLLLSGGLLFYYLLLPPDFLQFNPGLVSSPVQWLFGDDNSPLNKPRVIETVLLWGRLAPLPHSARHLRIDGTGQLFDKTYIVTFEADPSEVQQWLTASPGTSQQSPTVAEGGKHYQIRPRDAAYAAVTVDPGGGAVRIKTFWR
ncbi:MAG: hypothetical protein AAF289_01465 [Cyanobacteria bacterium P01_A01_bin.135]